MYDVCYVNVFDSFNPVIMFRTLRSKLQMDSSEILDCIHKDIS